MKRFAALVALALSGALAGSPALAVPGGDLATLPPGLYRCEKPGDILSLVAVRMEQDDFVLRPSSSYVVGGKRGSYLLTGDRMVMTGGPFEGRAFVRTSVGFLRMLGPDGKPGELRCVLRRRAMP